MADNLKDVIARSMPQMQGQVQARRVDEEKRLRNEQEQERREREFIAGREGVVRNLQRRVDAQLPHGLTTTFPTGSGYSSHPDRGSLDALYTIRVLLPGEDGQSIGYTSVFVSVRFVVPKSCGVGGQTWTEGEVSNEIILHGSGFRSGPGGAECIRICKVRDLHVFRNELEALWPTISEKLGLRIASVLAERADIVHLQETLGWKHHQESQPKETKETSGGPWILCGVAVILIGGLWYLATSDEEPRQHNSSGSGSSDAPDQSLTSRNSRVSPTSPRSSASSGGTSPTMAHGSDLDRSNEPPRTVEVIPSAPAFVAGGLQTGSWSGDLNGLPVHATARLVGDVMRLELSARTSADAEPEYCASQLKISNGKAAVWENEQCFGGSKIRGLIKEGGSAMDAVVSLTDPSASTKSYKLRLQYHGD